MQLFYLEWNVNLLLIVDLSVKLVKLVMKECYYFIWGKHFDKFKD